MSQTQQVPSEAPGGETASKSFKEQKKPGKLTKKQRKQQLKEQHEKVTPPQAAPPPPPPPPPSQPLSEEQFIPKEEESKSESESESESKKTRPVEEQTPPKVPSPGPSFGPETSQLTVITSSSLTEIEMEQKEIAEENAQEQARREASLIGTVREEEEERKRRIEENEILDAREGEKEASLIGTVIDEENERRRRIEEDYETYSEPLSKTKAMEEIERSRRIHSYAEQARQKLAASSSAKLFPQYHHPQLPSSALWTSSGLLKRFPSRAPPTPSAPPKPEKREQAHERYGEFISTTARRTSSQFGQEAHTHTPSRSQPYTQQSGTMSVETKSFMLPYSAQPAEIVITSTMASESDFETSVLKSKICKETYQSSSRPRLIVHHTGLTGKWKRATETVELHEGVDY